jgi:hypothetical protein
MVTHEDGSGMAEFDRGTATAVIRVADFAADTEAMKTTPASSVRNPDGSQQRETAAEHTSRIVRAAVMHLLEQGLVVFPPDIEEKLDDWIPVGRVGTD